MFGADAPDGASAWFMASLPGNWHAAHGSLRELLYDRLRLRPQPLVAGERFVIPGASLWTGARTWVRSFRASGLVAGDRVVLALPRTPAHVMVTIAAWWEGLTLCPAAPGTDLPAALGAFDARAGVGVGSGEHVFVPTPAGGAMDGPGGRVRLREAGGRSQGVGLIMTTSGTGGEPTRAALSLVNIHHQLTQHTRALGVTEEDRVLSVLPWHHAFGLLVDLWPALLGGGTVFVDPSDGREAGAILSTARERDVTRLSLVPRQVAEIGSLAGGRAVLRRVAGVVGGAPLGAVHVGVLSGSRLRVGYGQTEASPGITLGEPGVFREGWLGSAIGCETRVRSGELEVRGANVCCGFWRDGRLEVLDGERWHATGDLVEAVGGGYRFVGRRDHRFKLSNGRMIDAPGVERSVARAIRGDVAVLTVDGSSVVVVVVGGASVSDARVLEAAGSVGRVVSRVVRLADAPELRTGKGEFDRRALVRIVGGGKPISSVAA